MMQGKSWYGYDTPKVPGLRDYGPNSAVSVFNSSGQLLRVEPDKYQKQTFIKRINTDLTQKGHK